MIKNKKNLFIFLVKLDFGGIETNFLKISEYLDNDFNVYIVSLKAINKNLSILFPKSFTIFTFNEFISFIFKSSIDWSNSIFFSTGRNTFIFSSILRLFIRSKSHYLGIYSQFELFDRLGFLKKIIFSLLLNFSDNKVFFCTDGFKKIAINRKPKYINSGLLPLAVSRPNFFKINSCTHTITITTISRFVEFKKYIFKLIDSVIYLSNFYKISLKIYGYGPLENQINSKIKTHNNISLLGKLNVNKIDDVLLKTDLFVGSGSVIMESASRGIPTIVAYDDDNDGMSPGFYHEIKDYHISEFYAGLPKRSMVSLIRDYIDLPDTKKNELHKLSFNKCIKYYPENIYNFYSNNIK